MLFAEEEQQVAARIQLVFLGPSGSGKTNLLNNLLRPGFDEECDSTEGIELKSTSVVIKANDDHQAAQHPCGPLLEEVSETSVTTSMYSQAANQSVVQGTSPRTENATEQRAGSTAANDGKRTPHSAYADRVAGDGSQKGSSSFVSIILCCAEMRVTREELASAWFSSVVPHNVKTL